MRLLLHSHSFYYIGAALLVIMALLFLIRAATNDTVELVTTTVTRGDVTEIVSVSGLVEAKNTAHLAFPSGGIVRAVTVDEGDVVETGAILVTLEQAVLQADRLEALAAVSAARADRDELLAGPRDESRAVTNTTLQNARFTLEQTEREQEQKVTNALRTLRSSQLEAVPLNSNESATPPTITGTYTCEAEGTYSLSIYNSGARSGYSFQLSGLETGTYPVTTDQASYFGDCGLRIQFDDGSVYTRSTWVIEIPNTKSASYLSNKNAYELARNQAKNAIEAAAQAVTLAEQEATLANADPRIEALQRANAAIAQAEARLARVNAEIADRTLFAPFAGIVTDVSVIAGESVTTAPIVTLLAEDTFNLTARIPEIDIAKVQEGQTAEVVFDANSTEIVEVTIGFISPIATEIDGVAYYEAVLQFKETPSWIRAGLNADIDILVQKVNDTLRIPGRFLDSEAATTTVLVQQGNTVVRTPVEIGFSGNNGYVEVIGLTEGTTVVAP